MASPGFLKPNTTVNLWAIPAAIPPPGEESDFIHPHSLGTSLIVVHVIFLVLSLLAVAVRFYGKEVTKGQRYGWSDATCLVAFLGSIVHTGLTIYDTTIYYGRHLWDIPALGMTRSHTIAYTAVDIIYVLTTYSIKLSLLLLFHHLFWVHPRIVRAIQIGFVFISLITIPHLTVSIVRVIQCSGLAALKLVICKNHTVNTTNVVFGSFAVLTDLFILAIPLSIVRTLQMRRRQKFGVLAVFLAGAIACVMSVCRVIIVGQEFRGNDPLYTAAKVSHFSAVEVKIAIVCSCAPSFPAFFRRSKSSLATVYAGLGSWRSGSGDDVKLKREESSDNAELGQRVPGSLDFSVLGPELRQMQPVHIQ